MKSIPFILLLTLAGCASRPESFPERVPLPAGVAAAPKWESKYVATVLSVHDGDTFTARVDLGLGIAVTDKFRLNGVDCPELRTEHGKQVRDDVRTMMLDQIVVLTIHKRDKYGRWLADVEISGRDLADWLISTGAAKPYNGRGPKPFHL